MRSLPVRADLPTRNHPEAAIPQTRPRVASTARRTLCRLRGTRTFCRRLFGIRRKIRSSPCPRSCSSSRTKAAATKGSQEEQKQKSVISFQISNRLTVNRVSCDLNLLMTLPMVLIHEYTFRFCNFAILPVKLV